MHSVLRPDDDELVRSTASSLRATGAADVAFGGLAQGGAVRITAAAGQLTRRLRTIEVRPHRGLGGVSWLRREALTVDDYAHADITHDFDPQILGEQIRSLAVTPVVVADRIRALLYLGSRSAEPLSPSVTAVLDSAALALAKELKVRDEVDERVRLLDWSAAEQGAAAQLRRLRERLAELSLSTTDPRLAEELAGLGSPAAPSGSSLLTHRQTQVLELVALGCRNREIAERLALSETTVKSYLRNACERLGARTRLEAVVLARQAGALT